MVTAYPRSTVKIIVHLKALSDIKTPHISGIAPVKIPTIKTIRKIAKAAGKNEITRGRMSFKDLRSLLSALINFLRLKINHISPAVGRVNKRKRIK